MKTSSIVFSLVFCLFASVGMADTPETGEKTQQLRREIARMIDAPQLEEMGLEHTLAVVSFNIDENDEIVVQGVAAANEALKAHVRKELNGRKLKVTDLEREQVYRLKVTFRKAR